ncbi:MAG: hypothetical protein M3Y87_03260 [Myxococcota bacterium]|nr:hypothetical protein [Myxococcota bacterium]
MARRWLVAIALVSVTLSASALVGSATGCGAGTPASTSGPTPAIGRDRAIELARDAADEAGYTRADYEVRRAELETTPGVWRIELVHVPPTPPGAHCTVTVDAASGATDLVHGR